VVLTTFYTAIFVLLARQPYVRFGQALSLDKVIYLFRWVDS